jgi:hypothetical protein
MASADLQRLEAKLAIERRRRSDEMMARLARNGLVDGRAIARARYLHEQGQMISSGWLNAAAFNPALRGDETIVLHYAKVGVALLEPYCTPKGARQMRQILAGDHDAPPRGTAGGNANTLSTTVVNPPK